MEWRFAATDLERLQASVPRSGDERAVRGLGLGALIMGGLGGFVVMEGSGGDENQGAGVRFLAGGLAGAVLGLPLGGIIGAMVPGSR